MFFYPEVVNFLRGFNVFGLRAKLTALRVGPDLLCFPGLLWEIVLKILKENMFLTEKPQRTGVYGSMGYLGETETQKRTFLAVLTALGREPRIFKAFEIDNSQFPFG